MLYFNNEDTSKVRRFSNRHHLSFKLLPQSGVMADQTHHLWEGSVFDNPFHAMPYAPARGTPFTNKGK